MSDILLEKVITASAINVYDNIEYFPTENYYQTHLNLELQDLGYVVQNEVTVSLHYTTSCGNRYPLSEGLNGRIDILLEREKMIIETKSIKKNCGVQEYTQLRKYMKEYHYKEDWGNDTKGMLINFGEKELEVFYMYYVNDKITCEKLLSHPKVLGINIIDKTMNYQT